MIYLDTSVVLAQLLAEDRQPPETLWANVLISSRLLQYEVWTRIHARKLGLSHDAAVRDVLSRITFVELAIPVLARSLESFQRPVRTLDAREHPVDGLPTSAGPSAGAAPVLRFLRVRLKPGGKLTHTFTWWALRIPAPAPITRDDAGHRFVPKTAPVPLPPGEYVVNLELPLHGISPPESVVSTRMRVEKPDQGP